jgi:hypothetical protein
MKPTQQSSMGRLADLNPFTLNTAFEKPRSSRERDAVCRELCKPEEDMSVSYGCVEWYQYPGAGAGEARALRALA